MIMYLFIGAMSSLLIQCLITLFGIEKSKNETLFVYGCLFMSLTMFTSCSLFVETDLLIKQKMFEGYLAYIISMGFTVTAIHKDCGSVRKSLAPAGGIASVIYLGWILLSTIGEVK